MVSLNRGLKLDSDYFKLAANEIKQKLTTQILQKITVKITENRLKLCTYQT